MFPWDTGQPNNSWKGTSFFAYKSLLLPELKRMVTVLQTFLRASIATVVISTALICTLVDQHPVSLWLLTALLGAGYATIMGSSFAWANSFTQVYSLVFQPTLFNLKY